MDSPVAPPSPAALDNPYRPLFGKARRFAQLARQHVNTDAEKPQSHAAPPGEEEKGPGNKE